MKISGHCIIIIKKTNSIYSSGFVDKENIKDYQQFREQYVNKSQKNSNFRRAVEEMDDIISESQTNSASTVVEMTDESNKAANEDGDIKINSSVEYIDTVLLPPSDRPTDSSMLFDQISQQIQKVLNAMLSNNDDTGDMEFEFIENQPHLLKVAKIHSNGSCLFGTFVHQLFGYKIDSNEHTEATRQLRQKIVDHISENFSSFEGAIQCRVEDEFNLSQMEDNKNACQIFLNDYLTRDDHWGGHETIQAVQEIYRVNILIIRELSTYNYFHRFDEPNTRVLLLAYRLGNKSNRHSHNHYDSVCKIDEDVIWNLVEFISKRQRMMGS